MTAVVPSIHVYLKKNNVSLNNVCPRWRERVD